MILSDYKSLTKFNTPMDKLSNYALDFKKI